jgi:hypothetical protein
VLEVKLRRRFKRCVRLVLEVLHSTFAGHWVHRLGNTVLLFLLLLQVVRTRGSAKFAQKCCTMQLICQELRSKHHATTSPSCFASISNTLRIRISHPLASDCLIKNDYIKLRYQVERALLQSQNKQILTSINWREKKGFYFKQHVICTTYIHSRTYGHKKHQLLCNVGFSSHANMYNVLPQRGSCTA